MSREDHDHLILSDKMIFVLLKEMRRDPELAHMFIMPMAHASTITRYLWLWAHDYYVKHYRRAHFKVGKKRVSRILHEMYKSDVTCGK